MTPAGIAREMMVGLILDHADQVKVRDLLILKVGKRRFVDIVRQKESNGGSVVVDVRDLCAELNNDDLVKVCKSLSIRLPKKE